MQQTRLENWRRAAGTAPTSPVRKAASVGLTPSPRSCPA